MVGKRIRGGLCNSINKYGKANNKYMKDYYKSRESSHLKYWDVNNSYGWTISQKLLVNGLKVSEYPHKLKILKTMFLVHNVPIWLKWKGNVFF